ncbi:DnaD domain-containing protein [Virgibacillus oceani]|uniref:DnaB/C C-terminal domain-containing protein n=1 Tax=Virgibacillus oceani TaxID=1479511 RepID=A0A917HHQ5_9BACI|nr:DnaD domain protein [Virgibacillus oceani]GGG78467.1 hypothetical protein GCM10011398_24640 [Virgibacillus oceani]
MNYLKEMKAFYNRIIFNPLSGSAVALWHTLMHFNNLSGWQERFTVTNIMLMETSGVKGGSFSRAREDLIENGFIMVEPQSGSQSPIYQMISQVYVFDQTGAAVKPVDDKVSKADDSVDNNVDRNAGDSLADNVVNNPADNAVPLYKVNNKQEKKQKDKQTKTIHKQQKAFSSSAISFFENNFGKANSFTAKEITGWVNDAGEGLVLHAMKRALELDRKSWGYVKWILNDWLKNGLHTVEAVNAEDLDNRSQLRNRGYQHKREVVPDWFTERKQAMSKLEKGQSNPMDPEATAAEEKEIAELLAEFKKGSQSGTRGLTPCPAHPGLFNAGKIYTYESSRIF